MINLLDAAMGPEIAGISMFAIIVILIVIVIIAALVAALVIAIVLITKHNKDKKNGNKTDYGE